MALFLVMLLFLFHHRLLVIFSVFLSKHKSMKKATFLYFVASLFLVSCQSRVGRQLQRIEPLLNTHPDSALAVLNKMNPLNIGRIEDKAYYSLLKSAAFDKNYIDISDDSLICISVQYYSNQSDWDKRMKAFYYQGIVLMNAGNYPKAIVSFEQAAEAAKHTKDLRYMGLIHRKMGMIFNSTNNYVEAVKHNKEAILAFEQNSDTLYADYAKYALAQNYLNSTLCYRRCDNDSCQMLLNELRLGGHTRESLRADAEIDYARLLVTNNDSLPEAINIYRRAPKSRFWMLDYGFYALAFAKCGQRDSAKKWMGVAYMAAQTKAEVATLNSLMYKIDSLNGRYDDALNKVTGAMCVQDSVTRALLLQSLSIAQKNYYQQENELQKARVQKQRIYISACVIISILIIFSIILIAWIRKRTKDAELKEKMAHLALMEQEMRKGRSLLVGALFLERTLHLCGLSNRYYESEDESDRKEFMSQFKKAVRNLKNTDDLFIELEEELNRHCSGIMEKLKTQCVDIKKDNRIIISMFFAGVPNPLIQILMGRTSTGSLRTLRSRLRTIIKESSAPDKELFLTMLDTPKRA